MLGILDEKKKKRLTITHQNVGKGRKTLRLLVIKKPVGFPQKPAFEDMSPMFQVTIEVAVCIMGSIKMTQAPKREGFAFKCLKSFLVKYYKSKSI